MPVKPCLLPVRITVGTELEMTGLLVNISLWKAYLKRCEFDACVDHAAVVQIYESQD